MAPTPRPTMRMAAATRVQPEVRSAREEAAISDDAVRGELTPDTVALIAGCVTSQSRSFRRYTGRAMHPGGTQRRLTAAGAMAKLYPEFPRLPVSTRGGAPDGPEERLPHRAHAR